MFSSEFCVETFEAAILVCSDQRVLTKPSSVKGNILKSLSKHQVWICAFFSRFQALQHEGITIRRATLTKVQLWTKMSKILLVKSNFIQAWWLYQRSRLVSAGSLSMFWVLNKNYKYVQGLLERTKGKPDHILLKINTY